MKAAEIKTDLLNKIDGLNTTQLKEVYGLFQNYLNNTDNIDEWQTLTAFQKAKINQGIREADAGKLSPLNDVLTRIRSKRA